MDLYGLGMILAEAVTGIPRAKGAHIFTLTTSPLIHQLLTEQPADRGTTGDILVALANATGQPLRPWPAWLNRDTVSQPVPEPNRSKLP
jgi:hypothetical protein